LHNSKRFRVFLYGGWQMSQPRPLRKRKADKRKTIRSLNRHGRHANSLRIPHC
jgi:hypothetical protein